MAMSLQEIDYLRDLEEFNEEELVLTADLQETDSNPASPENTKNWEQVKSNVVAKYRATSKNGDFYVGTKSCKDRVALLCKHLQTNTDKSRRNLKMGCTTEEYETKLTLLEGIVEMKASAGKRTTAKAKAMADKAITDKAKGESVREAAMKTQASKSADSGSNKKAKTDDGIWKYMEQKRLDEKTSEEKKLALEERRIALEEKKAEDERLEKQRYWANLEADREVQKQKLDMDAKEKLLLFELIRDLKK